MHPLAKETVSPLLNEEFDYNKAIARILGRDVGRLLFIVGRKELSIQFRPGQFYLVTAGYTKYI